MGNICCFSIKGGEKDSNHKDNNQPVVKQDIDNEVQKNKNEINTNKTNINNNENGIKINQNSDNISDNIINNPKKPPLDNYNPNISLINSVSSYNTISSDGQQEILKDGGKINKEYKYKPGDIVNNDLNKYVKNGSNKNEKLFASSNFEFPALNQNRIILEHYINKKPGTQINPIQPRFQGIILQNGKRKDNKNEKENVSIHNSIKSGNSLYIPKRDNGPILDIENIS